MNIKPRGNVLPNEFVISNRRLAYNQYLNKQIQNDQVKVANAKEHIENLYKISSDKTNLTADLQAPALIHNWILKYPLITIKNVMPFTSTGDINDAEFTLFKHHNSGLNIKNYENFYCSSLRSRFKTGTPAWKTIDGFIGTKLKSQNEIKLRKRLDSDLSLRKNRRLRLSQYFGAEPETFCIFAERMRKNIIEW